MAHGEMWKMWGKKEMKTGVFLSTLFKKNNFNKEIMEIWIWTKFYLDRHNNCIERNESKSHLLPGKLLGI